MTQEHPITPPLELIYQWAKEVCPEYEKGVHLIEEEEHVATQAARWGADQELEACCELLDINGCPGKWIDMLRAARRPKPLSLKEQALAVLDDASNRLDAAHENIIRRALEQLND